MDSQGSREIGRKVELGREGGSGRVRGKNVSREGGQRVSRRKVGREPKPSFSFVFSVFPWPGRAWAPGGSQETRGKGAGKATDEKKKIIVSATA